MSGPIELSLLESVLVCLHDSLNAVDTRVEDVTVQSEAVRSAGIVRRDSTAEAVKINLLVSVVELKDITNVLDSL